MSKTMKISGLLWALLFAVGAADAAGLGKLSVQSALGQPLRAEIELLSVNKDELSSITARLAGTDAFKQARIDRIEALNTLRFSVDQRANGQPVIRVTSSAPIADPFLDMLIEVNWNSGRLLREYTVLLDPPADAKPAAPTQPVVAPEATRTAPAQVAAAPATEQRAAVEPAKPRASEAVAAKPAAKRYGPVKSGETLRGIAGKVKSNSLTLEQMMVGLYQANKDSFYADNMNRLKRGQVLKVPDAESVHLQASPSQAAHTVQGQAAEWHAYRRKLAEMAEEAPPAKAPTPAAGKLTAKGEEKAPPAPAAAKDVLKLSKGEPGGAGRPDGKTQEKLHALEEEVAAKGRALQEAQDRVGQLERTVRDMQKLLELKAQEAAKAPPAPVPAAVPVPAPAPVAQAPVPAPVVEPAPVAPPPVVKPKPAPAPVAVPAPAQEPSTSWVSSFIGNPLYIGGIVAAILLSVLLWMMMVGSRRKQGLNKFEDSIMTGGEFKNNAVFNATSPASSNAGANTEGSMLLTDFSRLGLGAIDTHEVDPIAEAEVYMAYGRDAQAEEILKEALNKDPSRHEIALKLLEIYAARKDTMAFETIASELYAGLGGQGTPVWQRAAEMGRSIDPSNPLYRATSSDMAGASAFASKTNGRPAPVAPVREAYPQDLAKMDDWDAPAPMSDDDFDIPAPAPAASFAPRQEARAPAPFAPPPSPKQEAFSASLPDDDFALEFEAAPAPMAPPPAPAPAPTAPASMAFDNDLAWDVPAAPAPVAVPAPMEEPAIESITAGAASAWSEPDDLDFEASPFASTPEPIETAESVPVLDLSGIDLDLEDEPLEEIPVAPSPVVAPKPAPVVAEMAEVAIDFADDFAPDLDTSSLPEPAPVAAPMAAPEPAPVVAAPAAAAPVPPAEVADPELWEEVNTKLDLARAYLEMGDKEGAREILQEVLGEGDAQQKADADKLLADAG